MIYHVYDENGRFLFPVDKEVWDSYDNPELREYCQKLFKEQMETDLEEINWHEKTYGKN